MVARNTGDHRSGRQRIVAVQIRRQGAPGGSRLRGGSGCGRLVDNGRSVWVAETETVLAMRAGRHRRIGGNGVLVYLAFKQGNGSAQGTSKGKSYIALNI